MPLPVRKGYTGNGVQSTLTSSPTISDTTFTVAATTNWPASFPFFVVVDPGTSKEEKMRVTAISTSTLTVVRGVDNTSAVAHISGAVIYPVFTASEADEANQIASAMTSKGDLIATDGSTINRLAVGATNTHVLQVDSTATNGFKWGQVATAGIADDAITSAKILNSNVTEGKIADNAVTSAKIASKTIVEADVATALLKLVCPVGTIQAYPGATAPTGWLLCTGVSTTGYTELIALVGATTPNLQGKVLVGKGSAPFDGALLSSFGSTTSTAAHTHVAGTLAAVSNTTGVSTQSNGSHSHKIDGVQQQVQSTADNNQFILNVFNSDNFDTTTDGAHSHTMTDPGHSHTISGSTGASDVSATHGNVQPSTLINYIIKHDYA